jgi:hypothetical protein
MSFLKRHTGLLIGLLILGSALKAQKVPYLERTVTIHANNRSLADLFKLISEQTAVVFSYSQPFNDKQKATINCTKRPLRLVLNDLLKETGCTYKGKDKYIILKCDAKPLPPPSVITGYIYNAEDSSIVANASIYVKQTRHSAQSNDYGFFSLSYSNKLPSISVSFARENYYDSTLVIYNKQKQEVVLYLYPRYHQKDSVVETLVIPETKDSVVVVTKKDTVVVPKQRFFSDFWKPLKTFNTNLKNISDTLFSDFAISLVPYVNTNRLLSINTVNKVSFNIIAGYSKGVRAFELGGILNIDNGDVRYTQIAGAINIVSGHVEGAQMAGVLNLNDKSMHGAQVAGVINVAKGEVKGVQVAGIGNASSETTRGVQLSGIFNASGRKAKGAQVAGICNGTSSLNGIQIAGIINVADTVKGFQLAGVTNASGQMHGMQLAGVLNRAAYVKGVQLGLINVADSSSGVSIGLFNYVKTGYHKLEINTDELLFGNVSFGTGTEKLYTIFTAGINYAKPTIVSYGYGLGTGFTIKNKLGFSATVIAQQMQNTEDELFRANLLGRAYVGLEYKFNPKFRIGLGPTFNIYTPNTTDNPNSDLMNDIPSYRMAESTAPNNLRMWVGGKISLKFF